LDEIMMQLPFAAVKSKPKPKSPPPPKLKSEFTQTINNISTQTTPSNTEIPAETPKVQKAEHFVQTLPTTHNKATATDVPETMPKKTPKPHRPPPPPTSMFVIVK
jgi:hypothetical protein